MAGMVADVHRRGVIHRDVCPVNFVLGERLTLVDFEPATRAPGLRPGAAGRQASWRGRSPTSRPSRPAA